MLSELTQASEWSVAISWAVLGRVAENTVIYSLNNFHELKQFEAGVADSQRTSKRVLRARVENCKNIHVWIYHDCHWEMFVVHTELFLPSHVVCRNCLIKQANMAEARRNFACLSVLYAKNIKFNKTNMYGEIFYSFSWKHGNFHSVSRHPTSRQLQQPVEWKIWNYHHSSKHHFLRIFDVETFYDMHTLICGSRRGFEWEEEIIITSK